MGIQLLKNEDGKEAHLITSGASKPEKKYYLLLGRKNKNIRRLHLCYIFTLRRASVRGVMAQLPSL